MTVPHHDTSGEAAPWGHDSPGQRLRCFLAGMRTKLGLFRQLDGDAELVRGLTAALQARAQAGCFPLPRYAVELFAVRSC